MRIVRITTDTELIELRDAWNALAGTIPFRRWEWLEAWWRHFGGQKASELFVLAVYGCDERLVGLLPCFEAKSNLRGRVVRWLGSGEVASEYVGLMAEEIDQPAVVAALADWLAGTSAEAWDVLELTSVGRDDRATHALIDGLTQRGHPSSRQPGATRWRVALKPTWNEYVATLSSHRRERLRRLCRMRIDSGQTVSHTVRHPEELHRGFEVLVDLHQRRRRHVGHRGCFVSRRFEAFHREVTARFLEVGQLHLMWSDFEGRAANAHYDFHAGGTAFGYQCGHDPRLGDASVGTLGTIAAIRAAIDAGCHTFDFLRGDEPYKASWNADPVESNDVYVLAQRTSVRVRHAIWRGGVRANRFARRQSRRALNWVKDRKPRRPATGGAKHDNSKPAQPGPKSPRPSIPRPKVERRPMEQNA